MMIYYAQSNLFLNSTFLDSIGLNGQNAINVINFRMKNCAILLISIKQ